MAYGDRHIPGPGGGALCGASGPIHGNFATSQECNDCRHIRDQNAQKERDRVLFERLPQSSAPNVVISMTTVPSRNGTLGPTIESLRKQTTQPAETRLYLGPGCNEVPGIVCRYVEDRGPVTKLSAIADPEVPVDAIVVTVDDDIVFHPLWLETLLKHTADHPSTAVGMAGWNVDVLLNTNRFERASGPCDVIEGFAGVAYRKWFFGEDVLDIPSAVRFVDDVWISSYLHRAGVPRTVVPGERDLINITRSEGSGIHTRPDFVEMNKRAAEMFYTDAERALQARRKASQKAATK